jgi:hypothetical protein
MAETSKTIDRYVEKTFPLGCCERDKDRKYVLNEPVDELVIVYNLPGSDMLTSHVKCTYGSDAPGIGGGCFAATPHDRSIGNKCKCPYSFDIPYGMK